MIACATATLLFTAVPSFDLWRITTHAPNRNGRGGGTAVLQRSTSYGTTSGPDNGWSYSRNRSLAKLLAAREIRHLRTQAYRPQTNGKVERFHQTMAREWAYGMSCRSSHHRTQALPHWLEHYNQRSPHSGIDNRPPISRVHNPCGQDS